MLRRRLAEDETFEQAVRRQAVRAVQPAFGHLARCVEAGKIGASVGVDRHSAAGIMLRRHHRDRPLRHVDAQRQQLFVDVGKMPGDESGRSEEQTSEPQSPMSTSYAVFWLKKKTT